MAAEAGPPAQHLTFIRRVAEDARRWGLFPAARGVEARSPQLPRIGRARRPSQSAVDLAQVPALEFPAPTIDTVEFRNGRGQFNGFWLGLTGPMGALPTHLTEFAVYERRYAAKRPFGRWLDVISNRMLQLFFRAWGESQPVVHADRPDDDRFATYLAALTGATEGVGEGEFPARARLHYAALFASRRSAVGIEDALGHLLRQPVRVLQFQPRWRDVEREDQTRLGRAYSTLGDGMIAGRSVRVASDAFRVAIGAKTMRDYEALLPSGPRFRIAQEALDAFAPSHLEWDLVIELPEREARAAKLDGRARLGWTAWVGPGRTDRIRADAHLRRRAAPHRRREGGQL